VFHLAAWVRRQARATAAELIFERLQELLSAP
jgi:hypothetical protein